VTSIQERLARPFDPAELRRIKRLWVRHSVAEDRRDIREGAVVVVPVEPVLAEVVHVPQVEVAVRVEVEEDGLEGPPGVPDAGRRRRVLEGAVPPVMEEEIGAHEVARDREVQEAVAVEVAPGDAPRADVDREVRRGRRVRERAVAAVAEEA